MGREIPCAYSANPATLYSQRLAYHKLHPSASFVSGVHKLCPRPRAIADWRWVTSYSQAHHLCFRGTQTVSTAACDRWLTMSHELQPSTSFVFSGYTNCVHGRVRSLTDDESRATAKHIICVSGVRKLRAMDDWHHRKESRHELFGIFSGARTGQWSVNSTVPHLIFTCPGTSGPA